MVFEKPYELPCILESGTSLENTGSSLSRRVQLINADHDKPDHAKIRFHKKWTESDKMILVSYGDWSVSVYKISSKYFEDRKEFDNLIVKEASRHHQNGEKHFQNIISVKEAFNQLNIKPKINMDYFFRFENKNEYQKYVGNEYDYDYYQWCWNEMKNFEEKWDWQNTESSEQYSNLKKQVKKIKSIINYKLMVEIFGENDVSNEDENLYNLKEFRLLSYDGNFRYASACNKDDYIGFVYGTS